ncbi:MAG: hypothetical protein ACLSHC_06735 [Bilophila wadsworthia]
MVANRAVVVNKDARGTTSEFEAAAKKEPGKLRVRQPRRHLMADLRHAQLVHRTGVR